MNPWVETFLTAYYWSSKREKLALNILISNYKKVKQKGLRKRVHVMILCDVHTPSKSRMYIYTGSDLPLPEI